MRPDRVAPLGRRRMWADHASQSQRCLHTWRLPQTLGLPPLPSGSTPKKAWTVSSGLITSWDGICVTPGLKAKRHGYEAGSRCGYEVLFQFAGMYGFLTSRPYTRVSSAQHCILGQMRLCFGGHPVPHRMFGSVPLPSRCQWHLSPSPQS